MKPFTYDVESVLLSDEEMATFANTVRDLCYEDLQHELSERLGRVTVPYREASIDAFHRECRAVWRTVVSSKPAE